VTFNASLGTLTLDSPSAFTGQIVGFTGDGTIQGSDRIDLRNTSYSAIHFSYDDSIGLLDVSDGTTTVALRFAGTYSPANFKFADDGSGGTFVYVQAASDHMSPANQSAIAYSGVNAGQASFIFAPNFGQVTMESFDPAKDTIQISPSVFANMSDLLAAAQSDGHGNVIITDAEHDSMTIQHVTVAELLAHQNSFHFL
jgi:hypothetical protein